uniref:NADH-ubiquinone oxidoreductase chain 4 n=1 Tax=Montfortula punctata TaxID=1906930 RepID=A0A1J0CYG6_9VEST|nr:NADH dehydrogenase subunit 4 [Montfortula punctata]
MLAIMFLAFSLLFQFSFQLNWYIRIWGFLLGTFFSIFILFSFTGTSLPTMSTHWFMLDTLSAPLITLTWWISSLMIISSQKAVKHSIFHPTSFTWYICSLNFILIVVFLSSHMLTFYASFEFSLIPTLILILGWGSQPERLQAGMYMMLYTITASLPLLTLIAVSTLSYNTPSFLLKSLMPFLALSHQTFTYWSYTFLGVMMLLASVLAFLVKLPMFSLHLWLPKAHVEAPVAGSMILAGVLLKLSGYGLIRTYMFFSFHINSFYTKDILLSFCLLGGVITSLICLRQTDLKALIAYSSIGHMSLMLAGILSNCYWGWQSALGMTLAHGLCSPAMFSIANFNYTNTGSRSIILNKGMLLVSPYLSLWWFLLCTLNMAAPPSINLLSEILVFPAILLNSIWLLLLVAIMSFFSACYSLFIYVSTQHGSFPKFILPSVNPNNLVSTSSFLLYAPANLLILKSEIIFNWTF